MICSRCGKELETGWSACPFCGTMISKGTPKNSVEMFASPQGPYISMPGTPSPSGSVRAGAGSPQVGQTSWDATAGISLAQGDRVGQFIISAEIGRGAFGAVYRARDEVRGADVALKIVFPELSHAKSAFQQLVNESDLRDRIGDMTHILRSSTPFQEQYQGLEVILLSMPLGEMTLREWLKKRPGNKTSQREWQKQALTFFKQACKGVKAVHEAGLTHLDLKPENMVLCSQDGELAAKIADFGLARTSGKAEGAQRGVGTPAYMAPEQFDGRPKDMGPDADVYALGCILFEILDGNVPFMADSVEELKQMHSRREPPMHRWKDVPNTFKSLVSKCLEKKPQDRYADGGMLLRDIERAELGLALTKDVSCPTCGHINMDTWNTKCEKCSASIASRFRPCSRQECGRLVRIDVDYCKCGENVGAHYTLEGRWDRVQELKDEDVAETIELLELILREGVGGHVDDARILLNSMWNKQKSVGQIIDQAKKNEKQGLLEEALKEWQKVLGEVPRHAMAQERVEKLQSLVNRVQEVEVKAKGLLDAAEFQKADDLLRMAMKKYPTQTKLANLLKEGRARTEKYKIALNKARETEKEKKIFEGLEHVKAASKEAPRSKEAQVLRKRLEEVHATCGSLCERAHEALKAANFEKVDASVCKLRELWPTHKKIQELCEELVKIKEPYEQHMNKARDAYEDHDLDNAESEIKAAVSLCGDSEEASKLHSSIKRARLSFEQHMKSAQSLIREAEFDRATRELEQAKSLWRTSNRPLDSERELKETRNAYNKHLAEAKKHLGAKRLTEARGAAGAAREKCPESAEISSLISQIALAELEKESNRMEAEARRRRAKEAVGKFGKWSGIAIAGAAGIAGVFIIGVIFWNWVKSAAWPWCVDHLVTLALVNAAIAFVSAGVHSARNTADHFKNEFGGNFWGALIVVGVIAAASSLLSVFAFNGAWSSGMAVGLVLGLGISLGILVDSFTAR